MRKRVLIGISILFIGLTIILLIPSLFKKQVSELLKKEINEHIRGDVTFSNADINLWRHFPQFTFTLDNFILEGKNEFEGDTLIRVKELHLVLASLKLLFYNEVEIRDLSLYDPSIHILIHPNGKGNYEIFNPQDSAHVENDADRNVALEIESLAIENGKFLYDNKALNLQLEGSGLTLNGIADLSDEIADLDVKIFTTRFSTKYQKETYVKEKDIELDLSVAYDEKNQTLTFKDNKIKVNHLELAMEGLYERKLDNHFVDIKFHSSDSEFKDILSLSSELSRHFKKLNVTGHFMLDGFLKGVYNADREITPAFLVNCKVTDGSLHYAGLPASLSEINFDFVAENEDSIWHHSIFDVKSFAMNLGRNPLKGNFRLAGLKNSFVTSDIIAHINLQDLEKIYPIDSIRLGGNLNFELKANGFYDGLLKDIANGYTLWTNKNIPAFKLNLNLSEGTLKYNHLPEAITDLDFHLNASNQNGKLEHTSVLIEKIAAKLGDNPISGFIHLKGLKNPAIESEIKADVDISEISNFFPVEGLLLKGLFALDMKVSGQLNDSLKLFPIVDARLNLRDGYIKSDQYPSPMVNTHLLVQALNKTGKLRDTKFTIDTLTYSIGGESFFIKGEVSDLEKYNYNLDVEGTLYLDKLNKIFPLEDIRMAGEVEMDFSTSGNLLDLKANRYHRLPTAGSMKLRNLIFQHPDLRHSLQINEGHFDFSNEKIVLDTLHGSLGESAFNLTGHVYNYLAYVFHNDEKLKADLIFESGYFNLNELMRSEKATKNDTTHHHLAILEIPKNIDFIFDTDISNLYYKDISIKDLQGEVMISEGVLRLKKTTFTSLDAEFALEGEYDTRDMAHPLFDIGINIAELDINKAHEAFVTLQAIAPAAEHTYGVFSIDYKLKGELSPNLYPVFESVSGGGVVRIREAKINGMKLFHHISGMTKKEALMNPELKDIVMETTVQNGTLEVKPFSMKLAGFETDIEGKHNLQGSMNYILRIALPPFEIVKIPLHVNGTYDKPKVHLGKGHEQAVKASISEVKE